jgi:hypothetical protein
VFFHPTKDDDHGGRRGNTAQAITQWWHPVTSREAKDALHGAMCIVPYQPSSTVIKITSNFYTFY